MLRGATWLADQFRLTFILGHDAVHRPPELHTTQGTAVDNYPLYSELSEAVFTCDTYHLPLLPQVYQCVFLPFPCCFLRLFVVINSVLLPFVRFTTIFT